MRQKRRILGCTFRHTCQANEEKFSKKNGKSQAETHAAGVTEEADRLPTDDGILARRPRCPDQHPRAIALSARLWEDG